MSYISKLDEQFCENYKSKLPPWGPLGYVVYKRTYSRFDKTLGLCEEWWQTVKRVVNGVLHIGGIFTKEEAETLYDYMFNLKCCISGRGLWQLGTTTVEKVGSDSLQACWHVGVNNPVEPFLFTFNELMLGGGVGFNITPELVYEMPIVKYSPNIKRVDEYDVDFIIPDNREGWVEFLKKVLKAFFFTGKDLTFSTIAIRSRGARISGFGGTASGPENLVEGILQICKILGDRLNRKLRPIDCLDIMNIIGSIVVAGNIRRSAEIAIGDYKDTEFLSAKDWSKHRLPPWRSMSNNTVSCPDTKLLPEYFWEGYKGNGEPYGLFNLEACRKYGRLADGKNYRPDYKIIGCNPCGEITLENQESCNLSEIFIPNIHNIEEFKTAASLMYKVNKTISCLKYNYPKTEEVVKRNHRLGIGVTGILQYPDKFSNEDFTCVYKMLESLDIDYSRLKGVNKSIKLTTVKPSGTLSLLPGVWPGIHPDFSEYYIRRICMANDDPLVDICKEYGYNTEPRIMLDGTRDLKTIVVDFPVQSKGTGPIAKKITAIEMLKVQEKMQTYWSDNSVSMTCYFKKEELDEIKEHLHENYKDKIKTCSFLLHTGHGFLQAPYEEITQEKYQQLKSKCRPIIQVEDTKVRELVDSSDCTTGSCPIK